MKCPNCETRLLVQERQGVEIDTCPDCRGVWLDRGELDKIIERSAAFESQPAAGRPPQPPQPAEPRGARRAYDDDDDDRGGVDYDGRRHQQPRRKSFWSELFD